MLCFSLRRQVAAINKLTARGMFFWDYGNAFLLEASRAGKDINSVRNFNQSEKFISFLFNPSQSSPQAVWPAFCLYWVINKTNSFGLMWLIYI